VAAAPTPESAPVAAATPPTDATKVETPKTEVAKVEPPKIEAAKPEPAKVEPPKTEAPKTEVAKKETPKTDAPKPAVPQEVILEALDKVEVSIRIDGESSKKLTLNPESVHTIKAKSSIEIEVSDGGMVNVIHNGRERGVPGDLGKSAKLKYP
jgi:cytoskeleton protein RodZ